MRLPAALATTLTWIAARRVGGDRVPLASETDPAPATAVNAPPQVLVAPEGVAITMPIGNVSVSAVVVSAIALALVLRTLIVSCDVPPTSTVAGLNDLLSVTLVTTRVTVALAAAGLMNPCAELTAPAAIVFVAAAGARRRRDVDQYRAARRRTRRRAVRRPRAIPCWRLKWRSPRRHSC